MNGDANLALFCDFENIALGVRDANYAKFDIQPVIERLLLKGSIVAQKGVLRLGSLQKLQSHHARSCIRADRGTARAPIG